MKVLIAEPEAETRRILKASVEKVGLVPVTARDGAEAWSILQTDDPPRLAILAWLMSGRDGLEICRDLRNRGNAGYVYVVLVTVKDRKEDVVAGFEAGADDFLTKPFDISELEARLRAGRRILELEAALVAAREALRVEATHDPLTGAWNRTALLDFLNRELHRSRRDRQPLAVAVVDLDHFKPINDTYGHLAGDEVLRETVRRIRNSIRHYDGLGRFGGEEFVLVLPGCDMDVALRLGERVRAGLVSRPVKAGPLEINVTASIGVAVARPLDVNEPQGLIEAADAALYRAKRAGRNRVEAAASLAVHEPVEALGRIS